MKSRLQKLRRVIEEKEIDAFLVDSDLNRYYLSGFTGTAGKLLITENKNYILVDFRYYQQACEEVLDFEIVKVEKGFIKAVKDLLQKLKIEKLAFEAGAISYSLYSKYYENFSTKLIPTENLIAELRIIKDKEEVEKIKKAAEYADRAFEYICTFIKPGMSEKRIALELEFFMKKLGGERKAFDFIVASGKRSSLPHGVASEKEVEIGDLITMDFGIFYKGYCSDITRTIVLGKADEKQKRIYEIVLKAQENVIDNLKPGMTCREVDALARDIIKDAGYGDEFGHSLGHGIGLEIHESPRLSHKSERILKPGMVFTNEPGIYIPDWGGIRIEDDLLLDENGCKVLTGAEKKLITLT